MKNKLMFVSRCILLAAIAKLAGTAAFSQVIITEQVPATVVNSGGGTVTCGGVPKTYYGIAKMTNSVGGTWLTPTAGSTNGVFSDLSGFPAPYSSVVVVTRKRDLFTWCGSGTVSFPATNTTSYQLTVYTTSTPPPPTNGQPLTLQVQWNP